MKRNSRLWDVMLACENLEEAHVLHKTGLFGLFDLSRVFG